jgi:asparaginyl-tRNA synthetase
MKTYYINDVLERMKPGQEAEVWGWIATKRETRKTVFLDLVDSTGRIQAVASRKSDEGVISSRILPESSVRVTGKLSTGRSGKIELVVTGIILLGPANLSVSPHPRSCFNVFGQESVSQVFSYRHLYIRNEKLSAVLRFRDIFLHVIRSWFRNKRFVEVHCPIITEVALYDEVKTAFPLKFFNWDALLTQCVAFHLESAAHALERVFCVNPSFRAEQSRGRRHLAEYWHVKAELAFADFEDMINLVEEMVCDLVREIEAQAQPELVDLGVRIETRRLTAAPFERMTYEEALARLKKRGIRKTYGGSLSQSDEAALSAEHLSPFWITGIPRSIEPFPYKIDPSDRLVTKTADLVAPEGFGEILGVAEKISDPLELAERMREKGKREDDSRYKWYYDLRQYGSVPHSGFGMGVERAIRWLLRLGHVRDAIAFPRIAGRRPSP